MSNMPDLTINNYLNNRIIFDEVFSQEECQKLSNHELPASVGEHPRAYQNAMRHFVPHLEEYEWVITRLAQKLYQANEFFNLDVTTIMGTNIVHYSEGGYLLWHVDMGQDIVSTRKLSSIVFLSDPSEYEGGKLVWFPPMPEISQSLGSMVIFPSFMPHRVEPVTKGMRKTLVSWAHGPAFR